MFFLCSSYRHINMRNSKRIYLDHAATSIPTLYFATTAHANDSSLHDLSRQSSNTHEDCSKIILELFGASGSTATIIHTSGGTESDNMIIRCNWDFIVSTRIEHRAVYESIITSGIEAVFIDVHKTEMIDVCQLQTCLSSRRDKRGLVSLMYINNEVGTFNDPVVVGDVIHKEKERRHGTLPSISYHIDAVQAPGHAPLNIVVRCYVDFLTLSAHKFNGPPGIGILYCNSTDDLKFCRLLVGGGQQQSIRPGTVPVGLAVAMEKALEVALDRDIAYIRGLHMTLLSYLLPFVVTGDVLLTGHPKKQSMHILSFCIRGNGKHFVKRMSEYGVVCSGGSACSSASPLSSHVLAEMDEKMREDEFLQGGVRVSFSHTNTISEIQGAGVLFSAELSNLFRT